MARNQYRFTSPPTQVALEATPEAFRTDSQIDHFRDMAASGDCSAETESQFCHIPFLPPSSLFEPSKIGAVFYSGALVDPRAYSPIAQILAERYGLPTVIPIFENDMPLQFGQCEPSGRLHMAQAQFEHVEKWILVGHSLGALTAASVASMAMSEEYSEVDVDSIGGLALMASGVLNIGCGDSDFSNSDIPMTVMVATEDEIFNKTRFAENLPLLSRSASHVEIFGGNHGQFGSYDDDERVERLGQTDGLALINPSAQWDITTKEIHKLASRTGFALPQYIDARVSSVSPTRLALSLETQHLMPCTHFALLVIFAVFCRFV